MKDGRRVVDTYIAAEGPVGQLAWRKVVEPVAGWALRTLLTGSMSRTKAVATVAACSAAIATLGFARRLDSLREDFLTVGMLLEDPAERLEEDLSFAERYPRAEATLREIGLPAEEQGSCYGPDEYRAVNYYHDKQSCDCGDCRLQRSWVFVERPYDLESMLPDYETIMGSGG